MSGSVTYLEAVVIGLVQGVAELFPVSSLGHAVLIPAFIGGSWKTTLDMTAPQSPYLAVIVALHVATACALILFFRHDWVRIIKGLISSVRERRIETPYERLAWLLVIGTIPVGIAGIILDKLLREHLGKPALAGVFLALNGVVLYAAEQMRGGSASSSASRSGRRGDAASITGGGSRRKPAQAAAGGHAGTATLVRELDKHGRELPPDIASDVRLSRLDRKTAAQLGAAQILGLFPGLSRSGSTIVAGLFKGLHHEDAARFAFLLATPAILGAGVYKLPELAKPENSGVVGPAIAGSIVAFIASYISVRFLVKYFETKTLKPFAIYCLVVGLVSAAYFA
ncbi:MAG TPA: undecaprenyl-diphosphate phosphatase [Actinocrinis sp.]|uniref:undecaprenyl-diphosphate phosphatase n=1 Tax=Actinocrinis sp. TaxID=1920516 RepID=UPI002DDD16DA|nr:undecaprenyl-diphosphate phosphatase [Actinocrinis sp.]HEV3170488.1 undecaprenyl-diphosphate phosphatase [Actinocrinis sp.]